MNDNAKIFAAALAGLAIGAIAGILFAPAKGYLTRDQLTGRFRKQDDIGEPFIKETDHHEELIDEAIKHGKLRRPAAEKLKEARGKITSNGSHHAPNDISGLTGSANL